MTAAKTARKKVNLKRRCQLLLTMERELWDAGLRHLGGVDEAGAGPLAGPVVAAAVILPPHFEPTGDLLLVNDSKLVNATRREVLAAAIKNIAVAWAVGLCRVDEIDALNIYHASCEAMRRAVVALGVEPEHLLVDARRVPLMTMPQDAIIDGDARSYSIAAASIVAKTHRDSLMREMAATYPGYGFEKHKGYGTRGHLLALDTLGPTPEHRRSFAPVRQLTLL